MWDGIARHISSTIGQIFNIDHYHSVGGGSINQAYRIENADHRFFLKLNDAAKHNMFAAEAMGLNEMAASQTITVPKALCWGVENRHSYIVTEWLELKGGQANWHLMGQMLAKLHQTTSHSGFGWHQNNTIGDTPQMNDWKSNWVEFFTHCRIGYQLQLARRKGAQLTGTDTLLEKIPELLSNHTPKASLVHGDLWSGNAAFTVEGQPVIFDPATYYGDREVDIAMSELFSGFPADFYRGYENIYPLTEGYKTRKVLYNLYHILNHFNLFGGSYHSQAQQMIHTLLRH